MIRMTHPMRAACLVVLVAAGGGAAAEPDIGTMPRDADPVAGKMLYAAHCAACHGVGLEGQDDWQSPGPDGRLPAPPHDATGHTWHHGDRLLFDYTRMGGRAVLAAQGVVFDSGMPGFGDRLTDQQIWNVLAFIKSTWPVRLREVQAMRTDAEMRAAQD